MPIYISNNLEDYNTGGIVEDTINIRTFTHQAVWFKSGTEVQSNMSSGTEKLKLASNIFSVWLSKFDF